jgi:hypothetical protein
MMKRIFRHFIHAAFFFVSLCVYADTAEEIAVKTGFIFNFFKFIEWSGDIENKERFLLCSYGKSEVGDGLQLLDGKTVNGKILSVKTNTSKDILKTCHMAYLEETSPLILHDLQNSPVVTISDSPDFAKQGGIIGLVSEGEHLIFEINLDEAQKKGLRISTPMLKLAKTVFSSK